MKFEDLKKLDGQKIICDIHHNELYTNVECLVKVVGRGVYLLNNDFPGVNEHLESGYKYSFFILDRAWSLAQLKNVRTFTGMPKLKAGMILDIEHNNTLFGRYLVVSKTLAYNINGYGYVDPASDLKGYPITAVYTPRKKQALVDLTNTEELEVIWKLSQEKELQQLMNLKKEVQEIRDKSEIASEDIRNRLEAIAMDIQKLICGGR